jgi:hypothetical protein
MCMNADLPATRPSNRVSRMQLNRGWDQDCAQPVLDQSYHPCDFALLLFPPFDPVPLPDPVRRTPTASVPPAPSACPTRSDLDPLPAPAASASAGLWIRAAAAAATTPHLGGAPRCHQGRALWVAMQWPHNRRQRRRRPLWRLRRLFCPPRAELRRLHGGAGARARGRLRPQRMMRVRVGLGPRSRSRSRVRVGLGPFFHSGSCLV